MSVIFLKGVNVGKGNRFDSKKFAQDLSAHFNVEFFSMQASGNIFCNANIDSGRLDEKIQLLAKELDLKTTAIILNNYDFIDSTKSIPFSGSNINYSHVIAYYSNKLFLEEHLKQLETLLIHEKAILFKNVLFINYGKNLSDSKITANEIDKIFNLKCTGRNINTIIKISERLD